ncbi:MAG: DNA translocase FtsK [Candidatus Omnitrophica bacterium]|nr:DNA translocase FtsK [Candidatus Omnitrophota bacterium]
MTGKDLERWVKGVVLFGIGLFVLLCLWTYNPYDATFSFCQAGYPPSAPKNFGGPFGAHIAGVLVFFLGSSAYLSVFLLMVLGWSALWAELQSWKRELASLIGLILVSAAIFSLGEAGPTEKGGLAGIVIGQLLSQWFGARGVYLVLGLTGLGLVGLGHRVLVSPIVEFISESWRWHREKMVLPPLPKPSLKQEKIDLPAPEPKRPVVSSVSGTTGPVITPAEPVGETALAKAPVRTRSARTSSGFKLPPLDLLKIGSPTQKETREDLDRCVQVIEETISEFGIEGEIVQINQGPRVTMYELQLAPGIQVSRLHSIQDNIAMSLKTTTIRIVAPLPGKSTVGIEVPNRDISIIYLREILTCKEFVTSRSKLTVAIGKDVMGRPIVSDLKLMPHLLIAGATGSGKTVCINSLIASLLYKASPEEVRFLMIDPKMVELTFYDGLPHLLVPVVTKIRQAVVALKWLIAEMERRYSLFNEKKVRNIESFNAQYKDDPLPYIVVVIDELADLMIIARNEIENSIIRLAQLSRAAGIHLILATQRPSVNVITGVIKANLPCRIAFQVPSRFDSKTIMDNIGAEKLLGRGDMLFTPPGSSRPLRIQGCFISDEEIENLCSYLKDQKQAEYQMEILEVPEEEEETFSAIQMNHQETDLYNQAKRIVLDTKIASISMLQRRLKIGFNKAAGLIEKMEKEGIVGPYREGKPREVLKQNND